MNKLQIISGSSNPDLATKVSKHLKIKLTKIDSRLFADGERYVRILENVRGNDVFIIQSLSNPVNENLMELLITIDALKRASANRITAIIPYLGYARQDRKVDSREPITAKLVANLLNTAGADRVFTIDLHSDQIQGFYDIPLDHFLGYPIYAAHFKKSKMKNITIVAPDIGAAKLARDVGSLINAPIAIINKRRTGHNKMEVLNFIGEIADREAILLDDMIDTGGTITSAANVLKENGAKKVIICASHGLFSSTALERIEESAASEVVVLDTIDQGKAQSLKKTKVKVLSCSKLLADAIKRIHKNQSLGQLFDKELEKVKNGK